jgi:hypothetical protein
LASLRHRRFGLIKVSQDARAPLVVRAPVVGERKGARGALEKPNAEMAFEAAHAFTDS